MTNGHQTKRNIDEGVTISAESECRYNRLTWPEINDAIAMLKLMDELREWPIEK